MGWAYRTAGGTLITIVVPACATALQPGGQWLQVAPGRSHLGINKVQGRRIREYLKKGSNHFLLSDGADPFHGSNVIRNQQHCFVVHGGNNLGRFVAQRLIEPGQGDLHHLGARALHRVVDGVSAAETTDMSA